MSKLKVNEIEAYTEDGTVTISSDLSFAEDATFQKDVSVVGDVSIQGNLVLGNADTDSVTFGAEVNSHIVPDVDGTYDLGSSSKEWRNIYIDGTARIDTLKVNEGAIIDQNLIVTGATNLNGVVTLGDEAGDNVTVNGVVGFTANSSSVRIGAATNQIDTTAGNLNLNSAGGTTVVNDILEVNGASTISGNVGIGTTNPSALLHTVDGAVKFEHSSSNLLVDFESNDSAILKFVNNGVSESTIFRTNRYFKFDTGDTVNNALVINASGNVGIGTTTPQSKLDVEGGATIGSAYSGTSAAPADGLLVEGNVGIGTITPQNKLDVEGSVAIGSAYSGTNAAPADGLLVEGNVGVGTTAPFTLGSGKTALTMGDGTTINWKHGANAASRVWGLRPDMETWGDFCIMTADAQDETLDTHRLYIDPAGNIGIGTTNPSTKLDVSGTVTATTLTDGTASLTAGALSNVTTIGSSGAATLDTGSNGSSFGGSVGIGTTTPQSKLDVEGSVAIGSTYSGTNAAPTDGLLVEGNVGIGTTAPFVLGSGKTALTMADGTTINWKYGADAASRVWGLRPDMEEFGDFCIMTADAQDEALDTYRLYIDPAGNIGIGTTTPQNKLDVEGGAAIGSAYSGTNVAPADGLIVEGNVGIGIAVPGDYVDEKRNLVVGATTGHTGMTIVSGNTSIGTIQFRGNTSVNDIEGWIDYSQNLKTMRFGTNGLNTRMAIDESGNVGIGTTAPFALGSGKVALTMANGAAVTWKYGANAASRVWGMRPDMEAHGDFCIMTADAQDEALDTYRLYIDPAGNIGVGTTTPQSKLDVEGSATIGSTYSGTNAAPANGLLVEGNVGIGTTAPSVALEVAGEAKVNSYTANATGIGMDAAGVTMYVSKINGEIVTTILLDLRGGIRSEGNINSVIGENGEASAYITQITTAVNGVVYKGEISCIEVPTTGTSDIDLAVKDAAMTQGTAGYDHALVNAGAWTLGKLVEFTLPTGGIVGDFLYLAEGTASAGTYDAGKFVIKLYGASF